MTDARAEHGDSAQEFQPRRQWHLEKSVSITHIISSLAIAGSVMVWANTMERRISILEERLAMQAITDRRQDDERAAITMAVRADMRDINLKLDRLIERSRP